MTKVFKNVRLERPAIVRKALELLNESGIEGLTTRRLADALGVQSPALYWHFRNKQELIDDMARAMLADADGPASPDHDWAEWLFDRARALRNVMLSYRDGARLFAGFRGKGPHGRVDPDAFLEPLRKAGFSEAEALSIAIIVFRFTFGWTDDEQAALQRESLPPPPIDDAPTPEELFEFGLATIIAGVKARFADRIVSQSG